MVGEYLEKITGKIGPTATETIRGAAIGAGAGAVAGGVLGGMSEDDTLLGGAGKGAFYGGLGGGALGLINGRGISKGADSLFDGLGKDGIGL